MAAPPADTVSFEPYATHIPALSWALRVADRALPGQPVVELGCGLYSTPWLMAATAIMGVRLVVVYTAADWAERIRSLIPDDHADWRRIEGWSSVTDAVPQAIGVCFVDQEELTVERVKRVAALRERTGIFVCHDADRYGGKGRHAVSRRRSNALAALNFKHVVDFSFQTPWTAVLSDHVALELT